MNCSCKNDWYHNWSRERVPKTINTSGEQNFQAYSSFLHENLMVFVLSQRLIRITNPICLLLPNITIISGSNVKTRWWLGPRISFRITNFKTQIACCWNFVAESRVELVKRSILGEDLRAHNKYGLFLSKRDANVQLLKIL